MEAGAQDDETKTAEACTTTPDGGPAGPVASRSAYTPLFLAQHEDRYLRRDLIKDYQQRHGCNLVVLIDQITQDSITLFAELLYGSTARRTFTFFSPHQAGMVAPPYG